MGSIASTMGSGAKQPLMESKGSRSFCRCRLNAGTILVGLAMILLLVYTVCFTSSMLGFSMFEEQRLQKEDRIGPFPPIQERPSVDDPFLFLHNRKCGGTTIRKMVAKAAAGVNASSFVGCYGGNSCEIYSLNQLLPERRNSLAVVAGHFSWDTYEKLLKNRGSVSCFTVLRDPISMFESYYYQRAPTWLLDNITLDRITLRELKALVSNKPKIEDGEVEQSGTVPSIQDEMGGWMELGGPGNSATRMFSAAKIDGHGKASWRKPSSQLKYELSRQGNKVSISLAKKNMRKCVVAILEDWEDLLRVVRHWYPWIWDNTGRKARTRISNRRRTRIPAHTLPEETIKVIERVMARDIELYEYGKKVLQKELEVVRKAEKKEAKRREAKGLE